MDFREFEEIMQRYLKEIGTKLDTSEQEAFYNYMNLLLKWNENINLTAITDEKEIILKHFIDSLTINKYMEGKETVMDIGTGAGFPGIPLKIVNKEIKFILVDSLNKRINFLEEVKGQLNLKNMELIHARAEDLAHDEEYREKTDAIVSRAVSNLSTLAEYMLPFVKTGGLCICMKGSNISEEIESSKNALDVLGGKIEKIEKIFLPNSDMERNIIVIKKVNSTPNKYLRKAGIPAKKPL